MSNLKFKKGDIEIREWDVVKLTNGVVVGLIGTCFDYTDVNEDTKVCICTTPISSHSSFCKLKHISEVIEHCGCFENQMDWFIKNIDKTKNNDLHINLED